MKLKSLLRKLKPHRVWLAGLVATSFLMLVVLVAPRDRTVRIDAQSEVVSIRIPAGDPLSWDVSGAEFFSSCKDENAVALAKFGAENRRLVLPGPVKVDLIKAGKQGVLHIAVSAQSPGCQGTPSAFLTSPTSLAQLPVYGPLHLSFAQPAAAEAERMARVFRLRGVPSIGDDINDNVRNLLLSGTATVSERRRWEFLLGFAGYSSSYIADTRELGPGDRVEPSARAPQTSLDEAMVGFVRVPDDEPMQISVQGPLDGVSIFRFSDTPVELSSSLWTRIRGDSLLTHLLVVLSAFLFIVQLIWQAPDDAPPNKKEKGDASAKKRTPDPGSGTAHASGAPGAGAARIDPS